MGARAGSSCNLLVFSGLDFFPNMSTIFLSLAVCTKLYSWMGQIRFDTWWIALNVK